MVKVRINCPKCNKKGYIELKENLMDECQRGITAINISEHLICKHSFIAYIDKRFIMRDAFISDFTIELPEININKQSIIEEMVHSENVDMDLLLLNLPPLTLTFILHACFNDEKILLINDENTITTHLESFFDYMFQESFKIDISMMPIEYYNKNKFQFENHVVIEKNTIINDKSKILNLKHMKIEKAIAQKYFNEPNPKVSLIIIKNEIRKAYKLAKEIILLNDNLEKDKYLTSKLMIDHFKGAYGVKIGKDYLDFLTVIASNYFKTSLRQSKGSTDLINYFN